MVFIQHYFHLEQHFFHLDRQFSCSSNISNWLSRIPTQYSVVIQNSCSSWLYCILSKNIHVSSRCHNGSFYWTQACQKYLHNDEKRSINGESWPHCRWITTNSLFCSCSVWWETLPQPWPPCKPDISVCIIPCWKYGEVGSNTRLSRFVLSKHLQTSYGHSKYWTVKPCTFKWSKHWGVVDHQSP